MTSPGPTLVIMAAGLGSRFGGVKQLARVGPSGEAIIDFSIGDAVTAGFERIVLIVRSDIEDDVRAHVEGHHGTDLPVTYVRQDDLGPARDKPWGTLHAVLSAADTIETPFAVINADDYYGPRTFEAAADVIERLDDGTAANIAFELSKTVPPEGAVTRALCEVADARLTQIVETEGCQALPAGGYEAGGVTVPGDTPVSMNFWVFLPSVLDDFRARWEAFLAEHADAPRAECQLPTVVGELVTDERLVVLVEPSTEQWIGITNPDDEALARAALADR